MGSAGQKRGVYVEKTVVRTMGKCFEGAEQANKGACVVGPARLGYVPFGILARTREFGCQAKATGLWHLVLLYLHKYDTVRQFVPPCSGEAEDS